MPVFGHGQVGRVYLTLSLVSYQLPFNRSLGLKAKDENEHLLMNLDFNWTQPCNVQVLFIVSDNDRPHSNLLPPEKGQRWYASLYAVVRRANPVAGLLEMRQPFLPLLRP